MRPQTSILASVAAAASLLLAGCGGGGGLSFGGNDAAGAPSAATQPLPSGQRAEVRGDYERLTADLPRAIAKSHWGLMSIEPRQWPKGDDRQPRPTPIRVEALLPDGRRASIRAYPIEDQRIGVEVSVGRINDEQAEREFIRVLQKVLTGKPMPKRGGTFDLPKEPATQPTSGS